MNMRAFKENQILHIEDDFMWHDELKAILNMSQAVTSFYGSCLVQVISTINDEQQDEKVTAEIERLTKEADNRPTLIHIVSGQVARAFLDKYIPSVIISDTNFPMNGVKTVEWLAGHGFENYPLIGLATDPISKLDETIRTFFLTSNARYFPKAETNGEGIEKLAQQVVFNAKWTRENYKQ